MFIVTYRFRQYGLWERYADLYPDNDLVYTVGVSDYRKDFFFAQVTRFVTLNCMLYIRRKIYESVFSFYLYMSFQCKDLFRVITLKFCFIIRRKTNNNTYNGSTWQIRFKLDNVDKNTTYKLRIALATAHVSELQVLLFSSTNYLSTFLNTYADNLNVIFHVYLDALLRKMFSCQTNSQYILHYIANLSTTYTYQTVYVTREH